MDRVCGQARRRQLLGVMVATLVGVGSLFAQTRVPPPANKYSPSQDVQLGRRAAAEAEGQLPILHDEVLTSYVGGLGRRLT